jgi:hypothetical protein
MTIANIVSCAILPVTPFADQFLFCGVDSRWAKDRASCTAHTLSVQAHSAFAELLSARCLRSSRIQKECA